MHLKIRKYKLGMLALRISDTVSSTRKTGFSFWLCMYQDKILAGDFFVQSKDTPLPPI